MLQSKLDRILNVYKKTLKKLDCLVNECDVEIGEAQFKKEAAEREEAKAKEVKNKALNSMQQLEKIVGE